MNTNSQRVIKAMDATYTEQEQHEGPYVCAECGSRIENDKCSNPKCKTNAVFEFEKSRGEDMKIGRYTLVFWREMVLQG